MGSTENQTGEKMKEVRRSNRWDDQTGVWL